MSGWLYVVGSKLVLGTPNFATVIAIWAQHMASIRQPSSKKRPVTGSPTTTLELAVDGDSASLIVLSGPGAGRSFRVKDKLLIGRDLDCDLRVESKNVSRHHARIRHVSSGTYALEDLNSRNGTTINGFLVDTRILHYGDRISIGGESLLLYTKHDEVHDQLQNRQRIEAMGKLVVLLMTSTI